MVISGSCDDLTRIPVFMWERHTGLGNMGLSCLSWAALALGCFDYAWMYDLLITDFQS